MKVIYFLGLLLLSLMALSSFANGKSHSKQVPYYVSVLKEYCRDYFACTHYWYICWRWGWVWRCSHYYDSELRYRTVCLDGWTGGNCDIPICKKCMPGYDCVAPNKCECRASGGSCTSVPCSTQKSCFPGTCNYGSCRCPTLFSGDDCQKIQLTPSIETCEVSIQSDTRILSKAPCSYELFEPPEVMVNSIEWKEVVMNMEVKSTDNLELPSSAGLGHIKFPIKLGVASSKFQIYQDGTLLTERTCDASANDAKYFYKCIQKEKTDSFNLKHGSRIIVKALAALGGTKEGSRLSGNDNSYFDKVLFTGIETWRKVFFKIDLKPPVHCYNKGCDYFPIQLDSDVTSNADVQPTFFGWDDKDSGIQMFQIKVFLMQLSSDDLFEAVGKPFIDRVLKPNDPDFNNFIFNCKRPGVHSIELTVYDGANNTAKARNIFIYTGQSQLSTNLDSPVRLSSSLLNKKTGEYWITDEAFHVRSKQLTISWDGYFVSNARFTEEWSNAVRPWGEGNDDVENTRRNVSIGLRTIKKMKVLKNGIMNYSVAYYVDERGGGLAENYTDVKVLPSTEFEHSIDVGTSNLGTTIGIILTAIDVAGGKKEEKIKVRIDTTAPKLHNFSLIPNDPDIYTSKVSISLDDLESGIDTISFQLLQILDGTNEVAIKSGEAKILTRSPPEIKSPRKSKRNAFEGPCKPEDKDCYCTSYRSCFSVVQYITIDHCWIDRQVKAKNKIAIDFEVLNQAGLTTGTRRIKLSDLEELHCRPTFKLTGIQLFGVVLCSLVGLILLSAVLALLVRIYVFKKPPPAMMAHAYSNFRERMHMQRAEPMTSANELYISGDDDVRGRKPQAKSSGSGNKKENVKLINEVTSVNFISEDDVQVKEEINKGSVLIISKGSFTDGAAKFPVAIKSLKNGASQKAIASMNAKAECLAALPIHDNIVKVFGLIKSCNGHMIVMEYCDMTLKSWLMKISDVSPDIFDDMLSFAVNISRGMEHLHENGIIHKRLAIRNVLLAKQFNQFVAKLIGFGNRSDDDEKASVPIKWLAPETLSTIGKKSPTYTEKSDAWSYGVTLWEMYTLGKQQPYPDLGSSDAKSKIISGKIMDRPDECSPDLYDKVMLPCWATNPKERPKFSEISAIMESIKKGEEGQIGYYSNQDHVKKSANQSQAFYTDGS